MPSNPDNKIRVFLYGHINHIEAFNLSARYLAQYLDKEKLKVYTLALSNGNLSAPRIEGVSVFHCFYPAKISNLLGILWGIYKADVTFVMRGNHYKFVRFCLRLFGKKSFKRQGNKIDDQILGSIASSVGGVAHIPASYNFCTEVYAPSRAIGKYNFERWGINYMNSELLPPFINVSGFSKSSNTSSRIKNIVFVGNDMVRKNIRFFLSLTKKFTDQQFHIIGKEPEEGFFQKEINNGVNNLQYHGLLDPQSMDRLLNKMDLHCFTSKSEGFGKVTVELSAKGIPSILFATYGANEWIENVKEGIIVDDEIEYEKELRWLIDNPQEFIKLKEGCQRLAERFSIERQVEKYENIILNLV